MVLREPQARCSFDVAGIFWNHVTDVNRGSISKLKTFANFKLWTLWTSLWFCGHWVSRLGGGSRGAEEAEDAIGQALPSSTSLLPAEVSGASSSQADQPEITVPTLVPGMVAATPNSLDGTQKELGPKSGRSPEALDWHSCDSSDSMEAAHLQRVQKSQNSTPSDDLVDSRSPQSKRSRTHSPTSRSSFVLPVACLVVVELVPFQMPTFWKEISGISAGFWVAGWRLDTCYFCPPALDSRMRSKGSRFTLGVWGLRVCSLDVAFTIATVRNRSQPFARSPYGRAYGKFCRGGPFWRFQTCRCFVSRGRRGTSWHSDVFWNVSKVVLRGRRNTFATFSEDVLQFSWQAQHFGRAHRHFSWQALRFRRVLLRVFCKSHWQGCVKWRQGANYVAVVAFCAMCWKLTEASHETSILRLPIFRF